MVGLIDVLPVGILAQSIVPLPVEHVGVPVVGMSYGMSGGAVYAMVDA